MTSLMEKWNSRMQKGMQFLKLRELPEAERCFQDGLVLAQRFLHDKSREMQALVFLGHTYRAGDNPWNDFPNPIEYYEKAADIARSLQDFKWESEICRDISEFYGINNDGENALVWAQHALTISRSFNHYYGQAMSWDAMGFAYNRLAKASKELANYRHRQLSKSSREFQFFEKEYEFYEKECESYQNALVAAKKINRQLLTEQERLIIDSLILGSDSRKIVRLKEKIGSKSSRASQICA